MSDNIRKFYPKDATSTPDEILEAAKGAFKDVIVLGWDHKGMLDVRSSKEFEDGGSLLWLLEVFKHNLLSGDYNEYL